MNKKASIGYLTLWIYRFLLMFVIIFVIIAGIVLLRGKHFDTRNAEINILSSNVITCFTENSKIIPEKITEENLVECIKLDLETSYLEINYADKKITAGTNDFLKTLCESMERGIKIKHAPVCLKQKYILEDNTELNLFIAITKNEKNS